MNFNVAHNINIGVGFGILYSLAVSSNSCGIVCGLVTRVIRPHTEKTYRAYRWFRYNDLACDLIKFEEHIHQLDTFEDVDRSEEEQMPEPVVEHEVAISNDGSHELIVRSRLARKNLAKRQRHKNAPISITEQSRYIMDVTYRVKIKFGVPKQNAVNRRAVYEYAVRLMQEDKHRPSHIIRDVNKVVPLVFTPTKDEVLQAKYMNAPLLLNREAERQTWLAKADSGRSWFRRIADWLSVNPNDC